MPRYDKYYVQAPATVTGVQDLLYLRTVESEISLLSCLSVNVALLL